MAGECVLRAPLVGRSPPLDTVQACIELSKNLRARAEATRRIYDRCQGLTEKATSLLRVTDSDGIPQAGTSRWAELSAADRLSHNLRAYRRFSELLGRALGLPEACPRSPDLRQALLGLCADCEGLLTLAGRLASELGLPAQASGPDVPSPEAPGPSGWEAKVWGHKLLRELSNWALRSVRDFNKLRSHLSRRRGRDLR